MMKKCNAETTTSDKQLKAEQEYLMGIALKDQPNIVQFIGKADDQTNPNIPLIVMKHYPTTLNKLVDGLSEIRKQDKVSRTLRQSYTLISLYFEQSLIQMIDIITGALHLVSMNIIHRDYKAENIFIDENNRCFIGDIGSSIAIGFGKVGATMVMSEKYAAPDHQQIADKSLNDIYSLGLTLSNFFLSQSFDNMPVDSSKMNNRDKVILSAIKNEINSIPKDQKDLIDFVSKVAQFITFFITEDYYNRLGWLEMIHLKRYLIYKLKTMRNKDYVPIKSKYPIQTIESVINHGLNWIEKKVKYFF